MCETAYFTHLSVISAKICVKDSISHIFLSFFFWTG